MKRNLITHGASLILIVATSLSAAPDLRAADQSPGQRALAEAASNRQFAFILFYRDNDEPTQTMYQVLQEELGQRTNAICLPIRITDRAEAGLVEKYDATRTPMPAVMAIAPNCAVTGVFVQDVTSQHVEAAIVTPGQAVCMRALQDQKLVLLCIQPGEETPVPSGVTQFQSDDLFRKRTTLVTIQAGDPAEARCVSQLGVPASTPTSVTACMAPPGVLLGKYDSEVTMDTLAKRLAAAGKCCDDPNCRHHRSNPRPKRQR